MNFTITFAREYGSGGKFIATKVAEQLNIPIYDKKTILAEAEKYGINPIDMEKFDEEDSSFYFPTMTNSPGLDMELSQRAYMATLKTIQMIASTKSSVIVGRCADYILSDDPDAVLKVFVYAPLESKVDRCIRYYNTSKNKNETIQLIKKNDRKRKKYYEFITERDWGNPVDYDLCVNSDMGIDAAVEAIVAAAKKKFNIK
jgi:cytidylate kinase